MRSSDSGKTALCFPGQGAHNANMLEKYVDMPEFGDRYAIVSDALGFRPLDELAKNALMVNSNAVSSLLTVLTSSLALSRYLEEGKPPDFVTGYSVGQYTALYAAGCFDFEHLVRLVKKRADLMDACFIEKDGTMMSIIGVPKEAVEQLVESLKKEGEKIWISNFNCFGQYSLSGKRTAIHKALLLGEQLEPKRLLELPVGGAWHCPLLLDAEDEFSAYLSPLEWNPPTVAAIDNVTGQLLPENIKEVKAQLVKHLSHSVMWEDGINTLIALSCKTFVEIGFGNILTRFGFFIDRSLSFQSYSGESKAVCAE